MSPAARLYLASACSAAIAASAFQAANAPLVPSRTSHTQRPEPEPFSPRARSASASRFPHPRSSTRPPLSSAPERIPDSAADARAVFERASAEEDDGEWIPDRERSRPGEVVGFDPENPKSRPLRNAAAPPSDVRSRDGSDGDRLRKKAGNGVRDDPPPNDVDGSGASRLRAEARRASEERRPRRPSARRPPPRREGPSPYAPEEEELIRALGGRGRRDARDSGGARPPPGRFGGPPGDDRHLREEGYLGDCTLKEISMDYSVPICYLADVVASWGAPVPVDPLGRLGDMVTGEQAFAVLEAIHTLDIAALHDRYSEDNLMDVCDYYDIDLKEAFDFAMRRGWALPFGVRTFLRVEQEEELLEALGDGY